VCKFCESITLLTPVSIPDSPILSIPRRAALTNLAGIDSQRLEDHTRNLSTFLENHVANLNRLRSSLQVYDPYRPESIGGSGSQLIDLQPKSQPSTEDPTRNEIRDMAQLFSVIVLFVRPNSKPLK